MMLSLARYASVVCGSKGETALVSLILVLMARKFNPFPDPKRGKGRAVLKRPAYQKTKLGRRLPILVTSLAKSFEVISIRGNDPFPSFSQPVSQASSRS